MSIHGQKAVILTVAVAILLSALASNRAAAFNASLIPAIAIRAADGNGLFAAKCVLCHGKDGAGLPNWKAKGQPDLSNADWQKSHTDAQIADSISNGKGKYMPAFKGKISEEDIRPVA
jgi:mono/diheme cytochrome c family protein